MCWQHAPCQALTHVSCLASPMGDISGFSDGLSPTGSPSGKSRWVSTLGGHSGVCDWHFTLGSSIRASYEISAMPVFSPISNVPPSPTPTNKTNSTVDESTGDEPVLRQDDGKTVLKNI